MNTNELKAEMKRNEDTQEQLAAALGLQTSGVCERINGRILLYSTNAPIGAQTSAACYQEYRNELMHTNSINFKTREI